MRETWSNKGSSSCFSNLIIWEQIFSSKQLAIIANSEDMTAGRKDDSGDHNEREYDQGYSNTSCKGQVVSYKFIMLNWSAHQVYRARVRQALSENANNILVLRSYSQA